MKNDSPETRRAALGYLAQSLMGETLQTVCLGRSVDPRS
jgi:hypothetical protein